MSYYRILVEPAKSSKGKCKTCGLPIQQDQLRLQVVDDRAFKEYITKHGGRHCFSGEGMSRGYIEAEEGVISIQKYFVHLSCYVPITPHPYQKEWFRLEKCAQRHTLAFNTWLAQRQAPKPATARARPDEGQGRASERGRGRKQKGIRKGARGKK